MRLSKRGYLEPNDRDDREALAAAVNACFYDAPTCDPFLRIRGLDARSSAFSYLGLKLEHHV